MLQHLAHFVWVIGAITALMGILVIFKPTAFNKMISVVGKGKLIYVAAASKVLMGILFLILATSCKLTGVVIGFGILMAGGATLFCMIPFAKLMAYIQWWKTRPVWLYRTWGIFATLIGALLIYAGLPK